MDQHLNIISLISGGAAGTSVDVILFPLDTIKTRLQSKNGFLKSGGFRGIYSGLSSAVLGSAPTAALFFIVYDKSKVYFHNNNINANLSHMVSANLGEIAACLIRVPVEVVKQRAQAHHNLTSVQVFKQTLQSEGIKGFYRGYLTTIFREIPFASIQFPLWEILKKFVKNRSKANECEPWKSALCGAFAGGIAAAITTPIDVAKTRIILSQKENLHVKWRILKTLKEIYVEKHIKGLFAGVIPRVTMISFGGFIFFGVYEKTRAILLNIV